MSFEVWIVMVTYQRFIHVAFKLNGLGTDGSKEVHNNLILQYVIFNGLDKLVANFIGLD
jgi:hypothetical protein